MVKSKKYTGLTLILAGGAIKSFSYLGFLDRLAEEDIKVDTIAGLSGGALISVGYGLGKTFGEMKNVLGSNNIWGLFGLGALRERSIISSSKIDSKLKKYMEDVKFSDLPFKLVLFATNITKKRLEYFDEGEILPYARASMALVPVISGTKIGDDEYIDPGFSTQFPTSIMKKYDPDNLVIGVFPKKNYKLLPEALINRARYLEYIYERLMNYMMEEDKPDMIIETLSEDKGFAFSFDYIDYYYEEGRKAAEENIPQIKKLLGL